ncbi:hypothetical protein ACH4TX_41715 [Streptomyces sp. NPDC021098]|uniref:hypothetical protein n=1 Tax=unclassified Streptomyces TaxID=2593676 RepID=UPI00379887F6
MADLINAVALLIVIAGVVFYSTLDKLTARSFVEVLAVAAAIRLTVAVYRSDWVQIALDSALMALFAVIWAREARKAAAAKRSAQ